VQGRPHDLAGIDRPAIQSAAKQILHRNQLVLCRQVQQSKHLVVFQTHVQFQKRFGLGIVGEHEFARAVVVGNPLVCAGQHVIGIGDSKLAVVEYIERGHDLRLCDSRRLASGVPSPARRMFAVEDSSLAGRNRWARPESRQ